MTNRTRAMLFNTCHRVWIPVETNDLSSPLTTPGRKVNELCESMESFRGFWAMKQEEGYGIQFVALFENADDAVMVRLMI